MVVRMDDCFKTLRAEGGREAGGGWLQISRLAVGKKAQEFSFSRGREVRNITVEDL